jgi:hypothetical protein
VKVLALLDFALVEELNPEHVVGLHLGRLVVEEPGVLEHLLKAV